MHTLYNITQRYNTEVHFSIMRKIQRHIFLLRLRYKDIGAILYGNSQQNVLFSIHAG